jgi:hypothetical protein
LTLGEVEKIAPDAIWRLDISSDAARSAFSHNLDPLLSFVDREPTTGSQRGCVKTT